jgi:glutamate-1-semialdehyde 2,1-aminomutase
MTGHHHRIDRAALPIQNRGVLMTPFHDMALMCPVTPGGDMDMHTELFGAAGTEPPA